MLKVQKDLVVSVIIRTFAAETYNNVGNNFKTLQL